MGDSLLLTIGALILVIGFSIAANFLITDNLAASEENEYDLTALSLAESVIDEAKTKAFDQSFVTDSTQSLSHLTPAASLGVEGGEFLFTAAHPDSITPTGFLSTTSYNDVDDYNSYFRVINTPRAEGYTVSVVVEYASPTYPDSVLTTPTFCKRMTVTVSNPKLKTHPLTLKYAFTN